MSDFRVGCKLGIKGNQITVIDSDIAYYESDVVIECVIRDRTLVLDVVKNRFDVLERVGEFKF